METPDTPSPPDRSLTILALLGAVMLFHIVPLDRYDRTMTLLPAAASSVDPNTASWYELTVLPRVGPATARAIVAYRVQWQDAAAQARPHGSTAPHRRPPTVYQAPADLTKVGGIGPKTVERIAPYLRFAQN